MKDWNGMMVSFFVILFADNIDTPSDGKVIAAQWPKFVREHKLAVTLECSGKNFYLEILFQKFWLNFTYVIFGNENFFLL